MRSASTVRSRAPRSRALRESRGRRCHSCCARCSRTAWCARRSMTRAARTTAPSTTRPIRMQPSSSASTSGRAPCAPRSAISAARFARGRRYAAAALWRSGSRHSRAPSARCCARPRFPATSSRTPWSRCRRSCPPPTDESRLPICRGSEPRTCVSSSSGPSAHR